MIFFRLFESKKNYKNMLQNTPNCTIPKQIFGETCPQTPLTNAWLRHASQATHPPKKNSCPPLANPAYAHELLKHLFENPPWQTVDCACSTLYVYALQNLFRGQKMTKMVAQHILKCITWALFSNNMCP